MLNKPLDWENCCPFLLVDVSQVFNKVQNKELIQDLKQNFSLNIAKLLENYIIGFKFIVKDDSFVI